MDGLTALGVEFILRVKGTPKVCGHSHRRKLQTIPFVGTARRRTLGRIAYCESAPHRLWVTLSRGRTITGKGKIWSLLSNHSRRAKATAAEYARRFGWEEGVRDVKWELGFAQARITDIHAWARRFAVFALAVVAVVNLARKLLVPGGARAVALRRRVASRRQGRWDLSWVSAMGALLKEDKSLFGDLSACIKFHLNARLAYVS